MLNELKEGIKILRDYSRVPGIFYRPLSVAEVMDIRAKIVKLDEYEEDYPLYVNKYKEVNKALIYADSAGRAYVNPIAVGQLICLLDLIVEEEHEPICWQCVHPMIKESSMRLYLDEHYVNAAEDAFIEVNERVKKIYQKIVPSGQELDGVTLMNQMFTQKNPVIVLGDTSTETGRNIQQGYQFLFAGAMSAFRNPKAHSNTIVLDAREAMRRIMFASSLMYKLDEAE